MEKFNRFLGSLKPWQLLLLTSFSILLFVSTYSAFTLKSDTNLSGSSSPSNSTSGQDLSLVFGGDVMLGRTVNTRMIKYADFSWPFRKISNILMEADFTFVNLESPFRSGCQPTDGGMVFCGDPRSVQGLVDSGVDVVSLANNHVGNQGKEGIVQTKNILTQSGIGSVGQGEAFYTNIKGVKIALVGFSDIYPIFSGISPASKENISKEIAKARENADLVIATFHWGNEYSPRSLRQKELARHAVDSGADLIIGHHPHWVQEIEEYKGKKIYYSLGNLVFDQMWSEETRKGLIVKLTYSGNRMIKEEQIPVKIFDYGQPTPN